MGCLKKFSWRHKTFLCITKKSENKTLIKAYVLYLFRFYQKTHFKIYEKCFLLHLKSSFRSWDIHFLYFFPSFPVSRKKGSDETAIIMSWTNLHKLANVKFAITQKSRIKPSKFPRWQINKMGVFLNMFCYQIDTSNLTLTLWPLFMDGVQLPQG